MQRKLPIFLMNARALLLPSCEFAESLSVLKDVLRLATKLHRKEVAIMGDERCLL
jgi:hypothetical protein